MEPFDSGREPGYSKIPARLRELMSRLVDHGLAEHEAAELARLLESSEECQLYYLQYLTLNAALDENAGAKRMLAGSGKTAPAGPERSAFDSRTPAGGVPIRMPDSPDRGQLETGLWSSGLWSGMLAGITLSLFLAGLFWWAPWRAEPADRELTVAERGSAGSGSKSEQDPAGNPDEVPGMAMVPGVSGALEFRAAAAGPASLEDLGVIVAAGPEVPRSMIGQRLGPGVLAVEKGEVQVEFMGGAVVSIRAPAELQLVSRNSATLISGMASARVPERARGFTLNTPGAAVVDLGTEFVAEVSQSGDSRIQVVDGEVELSLLGEDGNTLTSHRLHQSAEVQFDVKSQSFSRIDAVEKQAPPATPAALSPLKVSREYVELVRQASPTAYWRFESVHGALVANEMGTQLPLRIHTDDREKDAIRIEDGLMIFTRSAFPRYAITDALLEPFTAQEFTAEMWLYPDDLQHATCLSIFPDWSSDADAKLSVIEVVTDTFLIHQPGSIRALYRNPPVQSPDQGVNLFTPGMASPGRWQHVAFVKARGRVGLYFDGTLYREVSVNDQETDRFFRMHLGQLSLHHALRQFSGRMDEVAIYNRALTGEEIRARVQLMMPGE